MENNYKDKTIWNVEVQVIYKHNCIGVTLTNIKTHEVRTKVMPLDTLASMLFN
jgi:hypothetical protein